MRTTIKKLITVSALAVTGIAATASSASADLPDLNRLPQVQFQGQTGDQLGDSIASGSCDVNGDGYADAIAGAWGWALTPGSTGLQGATYLMMGGPEPAGGDLTSAATDSILLKGAHPDDMTGWTVGCADVNGDGFGDMIIGADHVDTTYVLYGAADFDREKVIDLARIGERGFVIERDPSQYRQALGHTVAGVGDLDGDGLEEFAVGASEVSSNGLNQNGRIYVFKGRTGTSTLTAGDPDDVLMVVDGGMDSERLSSERGGIANVGDMNGDGKDEIAFGSAFTQPWGANHVQAGRTYVVSGQARGPVDLAKPLGNKGFVVNGPARARDRAGTAVAGGVDVNGDGLDDLIVGADGQSNAATGSRNGRAFVVFGSPFGENVNLGQLAASGRGYVIEGAATDDRLGYSVAGIDDLDGDGRAEVVVGAYRRTGWAGAYQGAVYLLKGKTDGAPLDLASLDPAMGSMLVGGDAGDQFGRQVANIGDFDGNGTDDIAVGADGAVPFGRTAPLGATAGEVTVLLMPDRPRAAAAQPETPQAGTGTTAAPTIALLRKASTSGSRTFVVGTISCPEAACGLSGRASGLRAAGKGSRATLVAPRRVASGSKAKIRLRIPKRVLRQIGAGKPAKVDLLVRAVSPVGSDLRELRLKLTR